MALTTTIALANAKAINIHERHDVADSSRRFNQEGVSKRLKRIVDSTIGIEEANPQDIKEEPLASVPDSDIEAQDPTQVAPAATEEIDQQSEIGEQVQEDTEAPAVETVDEGKVAEESQVEAEDKNTDEGALAKEELGDVSVKKVDEVDVELDNKVQHLPEIKAKDKDEDSDEDSDFYEAEGAVCKVQGEEIIHSAQEAADRTGYS